MKYAGRIHRLFQLVTTLQSGVALTADQLAAELGVSRRTLFRDLKVLDHSGIPYQYEPGLGYQMGSGFFLPPLSLKPDEAMGLVALSQLADLAGRDRPLLGDAQRAVRKLISTIPEPLRDACDQMMRHASIESPMGISACDQSDFSLLLGAIEQRRVVRLAEACGPTRTGVRPFHPYHLRLAGGAWHVLGMSPVHRAVRAIRLNRIRDLRLADERFEMRRPFDPQEYLGKAWCVQPEGRVYEIELEFEARAAERVRGIRWHATQRHRELGEGRCLLRFEVDGLEEIAQWLVGFGDAVSVRRPGALCDRLIELHEAAIAQCKRRLLSVRMRMGSADGADDLDPVGQLS